MRAVSADLLGALLTQSGLATSSTITAISIPNETVQQNHWSERGRATAVANSDALGRPRRSVLSLDNRAMNRTISFNRYRYYLLSAAVLVSANFIYAFGAEIAHLRWYLWLIPLMSLIMAWQAIRLEKVAIDDQNLYISRFGRACVIPNTKIQAVTGGSNTLDFVCVTFSETTAVGEELFFYPRSDDFRLDGRHNDVEELKKLADNNTRPRTDAQPCASPSGGPATQLGKSGVTEGPPSVS